MIRAAITAAALLLTMTTGSDAQNGSDGLPKGFSPVPFGPGERMTYRVVLGIVGNVGTGTLEVVDLDTVNGFPSYELHFQLKGGVPLAHVDDSFRSWLDARSLISRRFKQDQKEVRYERHRNFEFLP